MGEALSGPLLRPLFAELDVDEQQALADRLRAEGIMDAGGSGTVWWIVLCVIGLLVAAALLVLAGQQRRRRDAYGDGPSFDGYAVGDDEPSLGYEDDFASVEIEERPAMPWQGARDDEADPAENVVPIRSPAVLDPAEPEPEEAPARYAFAAGAGAAAVGAALGASGLAARTAPVAEAPRTPEPAPLPQERPMSRSVDDRPRPPSGRDPLGREPLNREPSGGVASGYGADDQPFVAPFIREDIERAERRQADRIETLRDEVSRQFAAMKSENASRLDLFVSAVDRKLEGLGASAASAFSEHDMQRVTEGSVRPVFERLERLTAQVSTQEQRLADLAQLIEMRLGDLPGVRADLHETTAMVSTLRDRTTDTQDRLDHLSALLRDRSDGVMGEVGTLREGMSRLERAILDRASEDGSVSVALSEVVRGTLEEGAYEFSRRLSNGETADCAVSFAGREAMIAIDAGFPMEAFDQLPSREAVRKNLPQAKAGEDHFRRAILRAILAAADRCIVPGETTDSCLLFLPSEAAYTILHDRFGDLVRDAQRARVWLTSPSTLMGTLNLLSNLMPSEAPALREDEAGRARAEAEAERDEERRDAEKREAEKRAADAARRDRARAEADKREAERRAMRDEIKALRERAAGLAGELDRTRGTLSELIDTTERLSEAEDDDFTAPDWAEDDREDPYDD